ncbi:AAA family ATPase [Pseudomonas sp. WS 5086]|uniref:AAA family ATPase n=1 Tax=Pseudomonas sp. WS 5086 TaxID=2717484 RepID=UPI001475BF83|nr:AAA family ATPase [Pseudomonas sp. WS 5086]NMX94949.1 AAA family ATPase [Pseudomonas sp. WS 5086]
MILVVGGEKGGAGKSCIAQNLSVWLKREGHDVLLLDADPQKTSYLWAQERLSNNQLIELPVEHATGDLRRLLQDRAKRYAAIVVDVGGADSVTLRSAMTVATHILFPLRPKRRDLKTLENLEHLVSLTLPVNPDVIVRTVISQAPTLPSQITRILDAKDACTSFGLKALNAIVYNRNVYDDADESGSSVIELGTDPKASDEIKQLATELWSI